MNGYRGSNPTGRIEEFWKKEGILSRKQGRCGETKIKREKEEEYRQESSLARFLTGPNFSSKKEESKERERLKALGLEESKDPRIQNALENGETIVFPKRQTVCGEWGNMPTVGEEFGFLIIFERMKKKNISRKILNE